MIYASYSTIELSVLFLKTKISIFSQILKYTKDLNTQL